MERCKNDVPELTGLLMFSSERRERNICIVWLMTHREREKKAGVETRCAIISDPITKRSHTQDWDCEGSDDHNRTSTKRRETRHRQREGWAATQRAVVKTEISDCGWRDRKQRESSVSDGDWFVELCADCYLDLKLFKPLSRGQPTFSSAVSDQWYKPEVERNKNEKSTETFMFDDPLLGLDATDEE